MKKRAAASFLAVMTAFVMLFQVSVPAMAANGSDNKNDDKKTEAQTVAKTEGEGFDSPVEAIRAYAEALKSGDLEKMLSTFAVESVVENYDNMAFIARIRSIMPGVAGNSIYPPYSEDSVFTQSSVEKRRRMITKEIDDQLLTIKLADAGYLYDPGDTEKATEPLEALYKYQSYSFSPDNEGFKEAEEFIEALSKTPDLSKMEVGESLYPEGLTENYFTYNNFRVLYQTGQMLGADGYRSMALHLTINGKEALLFMDTVKYGEKWYNYTLNANMAILLNVNSTSGGIAIFDRNSDDWDEAFDEYIDDLITAADYIKGDLEEEWEEQHKALLEEAGVKTEAELEKAYEKIKTEAFENYLRSPEYMTFEEASEYFDFTSL